MDIVIEPLMSSGSPLRIPLAFLGCFHYALIVSFSDLRVLVFTQEMQIYSFRLRACLLGTNPAQGIPVMMWDEFVMIYSFIFISV